MRSSRPDARKCRGRKTLCMDENIIVTISREYKTTPRAGWSQGSFVGLPLWPQNWLCQSERSCPLSARCVGTDQHLDSAAALPATLSGFIAFGLRLTEGACVDLASGHSGIDQGVTNGVDTTFTQALVVRVGAARIGVAVDAHPSGRILLEVGRHVRDMARLVRPNGRLVEIEQEIPERGPLLCRTSPGLGSHRSGWTLRAHGAGWAHGTGCSDSARHTDATAELCHGPELIDAKIARFTRWIF